MDRRTQEAQARQGRFIALLIAGTGIVWMLVQYIGPAQGWSLRTIAFFDFAALGCFAFALIMAFGLWRARQGNGRNNKD